MQARVFQSHIFALTCAEFSYGLATVDFESVILGRNETRTCDSQLHIVVYLFWTGGCLLKKGTMLSLSALAYAVVVVGAEVAVGVVGVVVVGVGVVVVGAVVAVGVIGVVVVVVVGR